MTTVISNANHTEIEVRYAWLRREQKLRRGSPKLIACVRLRDLEALYFDRYGGSLPDDEAGLDDVEIAANHIAHLAGNAEQRILAWARNWAPWLWRHEDVEPVQFAKRIATNPRRFKAATLASRLRLTEEERSRLGITTIRPFGWTDEMMAAQRQKSKRVAATTRRRAAGAIPREESAAQTQPWLAMGMSRAKWYRDGKPTSETNSYPAYSYTHMVDTNSSHLAVSPSSEGLSAEERSDQKVSVTISKAERPVPAAKPHLADEWLLNELGDISDLAGGRRRFEFLRKELIAGTLYANAIRAASCRAEIAA